MNRYTTAGILADMRNGRRVLVLSETQNLARRTFATVAANATDSEQVRRANGAEQITAADGHGWVKFCSVRSGLRGITADVVVFDGVHPDRDMLDAIRPNLAASPVGEVVQL